MVVISNWWEVGLKRMWDWREVDSQNWWEVGGWPPKEGGTEVDTPATLPEGNMAGVSHRGVFF